MRKSLIDKSGWAQGWDAHIPGAVARPAIDPLLKKHLPGKAPGANGYSLIELGCSPGNNLVYFARDFSYKVTGLDYAGMELTKRLLNESGVQAELIERDMFDWRPDAPYDVVFSSGVLEHFDPPDEVFRIHKNACAPGGHVVICVPNMRYANKVVADILCPGLSGIHNLKILSPHRLRAHFEGGGFDVLYCDYYKTSLLNIKPGYDFWGGRRWLKKIHTVLGKILALLRLDNIPNRFFSPNIVIIARKNPESNSRIMHL